MFFMFKNIRITDSPVELGVKVASQCGIEKRKQSGIFFQKKSNHQ